MTQQGPSPAMPRRIWLAGFTLVEMVVVLLIIGIMSAVAVPLLSSFFSPSVESARQSTLSALRQARATAFGHRRLVCVIVSGASIEAVQALNNPATACSGSALMSASGSTNFIPSLPGLVIVASPVSMLYFQPDGRLTRDLSGALATDFTLSLSVAGQPVATNALVTLSGASGSAQ